jgi:hypothetical protein
MVPKSPLHAFWLCAPFSTSNQTIPPSNTYDLCPPPPSPHLFCIQAPSSPLMTAGYTSDHATAPQHVSFATKPGMPPSYPIRSPHCLPTCLCTSAEMKLDPPQFPLLQAAPSLYLHPFQIRDGLSVKGLYFIT